MSEWRKIQTLTETIGRKRLPIGWKLVGDGRSTRLPITYSGNQHAGANPASLI